MRTIVFADLVMGFDNVIAIAGATHGRLLLVIIGLLISIPIIIWGDKLILILMERFPLLIYCGAADSRLYSWKDDYTRRQTCNFFHNNPSFTTSIPFLFIFTVLCIGIIVQQVRIRNVKQ